MEIIDPGDLFQKVCQSRLLHGTREAIKKFLKQILRDNKKVIDRLRSLEMGFYERIAQGINCVIETLSSPKDSQRTNQSHHGKGVNLFGFLTGELGIGEGARINARCLKAVGVNVCLVNMTTHLIHRQNDASFSEFSKKNPYRINLLHVNAESLPTLYAAKGESRFRDKYNIGCWVWELSEFPEEWLENFRYCQEIWTPSKFAEDSITKKSPIPVLKIPYAVGVDRVKQVNRSYFGLKEDEFVFLFLFDFFSYFERKNPMGLIEAFKKAFFPGERVKLVIKYSNSSFNPEGCKRMKESGKGLKINFIDGYLYRDEVNTLISHCDCCISLHRSEGFGLTMAEAMYLGKPVIATGYSGNMDFMNAQNSYLVRYKLKEIEKDIGPYKKGNVWAEPDVDHAAELMRYVYENKEMATQMGKTASEYIYKELSYSRIGNQIKDRIELLV